MIKCHLVCIGFDLKYSVVIQLRDNDRNASFLDKYSRYLVYPNLFKGKNCVFIKFVAITNIFRILHHKIKVDCRMLRLN